MSIDDLDTLTALVEKWPGLYLRYSEGPAADLGNGPSRDVEAGVEMAGWSVTPLYPEPWWTRSTRDWVARRVCKYVELGTETGRRPWVLHGRVVGCGPDHEPLVTDLVFVDWLGDGAVDESREHYARVFDEGRASDEVRQ